MKRGKNRNDDDQNRNIWQGTAVGLGVISVCLLIAAAAGMIPYNIPLVLMGLTIIVFTTSRRINR